jgi:hypothetical protein
MDEHEKKGNVTTLQRVARIWSVFIFLITLLVVIGEVAFPHTGEAYPLIENLMPISMLISIASLGLAWKWELLAGVLNILFFFATFILYWVINARPFPLKGLAPLSLAVIPGILFIISWWRSRSVDSPET